MAEIDFEEFQKGWLEIINKIERENRGIDSHGASVILLSFSLQKEILKMFMDEDNFSVGVWSKMEMLESKLVTTLKIAETKYKLQSKSLQVRTTESIAAIIKRILEIIIRVLKPRD